MSPATQVILSSALTFGVPLLLAVRELIALRRWRDEPGGRDGPAEPRPLPLPPGGGLAVKPLPACLIPVRRPDLAPNLAPERRERVLEPV